MVIHEANARAGLANRVGARSADRVLSAVPDCGLRRAEVVGVPVRQAITGLDRAALRAEARRISASPTTPGCCWCSAVRRARSHSTGRCQRPRPTWPPRVFPSCMPRPQERLGAAHARRR
ncbi:putative beta-N-acetylglucosaminyltransferase [Mycobacterium kansasii 732]|nr:putative beta-N-acetylglucosaminyltransferase [Mycobacterium kansasii 732]